MAETALNGCKVVLDYSYVLAEDTTQYFIKIEVPIPGGTFVFTEFIGKDKYDSICAAMSVMNANAKSKRY